MRSTCVVDALMAIAVVSTALQNIFHVSCTMHKHVPTTIKINHGEKRILSSSTISSIGGNSDTKPHQDAEQEHPSVLIIDVDNCLYHEQDLTTNGLIGIEEQIVANIYRFGESYFNFTPDILEEMYIHHGSTIEGLRHMMLESLYSNENLERILRSFYLQVYQDIDVSILLPKLSIQTRNTGYNHNKSHQRIQNIATQLKALKTPFYLASNSPKFHVLRVLSALGLSDIPYHGIITPDSFSRPDIPYPTKNHPLIFYHEILEKFPMHRIVLLDDSLYNLDKAMEVGIEGIQVNHHHSFEEALAMYCGHILPSPFVASHFLRDNGLGVDDYSFNDVRYIQEKNIVDENSLNPTVWKTLGCELQTLLQEEAVFRIYDLGAGLLSMLRLILFGGKSFDSLLSLTLIDSTNVSLLQYTAYESNKDLLQTNIENLRIMGFNIRSQDSNTGLIFFREKDYQVSVDVELILKTQDFRSEDKVPVRHRPHMIVGCCFADLFNPEELAVSILRLIESCTAESIEGRSQRSRKVLLYFPITFSGTTQFIPSMPYNLSSMIPSDTLAFQQYQYFLETEYGHNTDIRKIIWAFDRFGMNLILDGFSNWQEIHPDRNSYLWQTLLYFFGLCAAPELMKSGWDSKGWINRARLQKPIIQVANKDLLFDFCSINPIKSSNMPAESANYIDELWFVGPRSVAKVRNEPAIIKPLEPGHVEGKYNMFYASLVIPFDC